MLKPIDMTVFVFVYLLFVAGIHCAGEIKLLQIGTSGTIPCGNVANDPEVRLVQWYKSRRKDTFENGDPSLASWANGITGSLPNYHMENITFSLVIEKAALEDEGLYQCSVERGDLFIESHYNIPTVMYVLPRLDPEITLDTDYNLVHCIVKHVKPMIYPVLNFEGILSSISEIYAVLNEDGTYTTRTSCTLPQTKIVSQVDCSFSFLNYQRVASLDLSVTTTDGIFASMNSAVKIKFLQIGTSGTIPCDHIERDPEVRLVQWYKSRNNDVFENGDPSLASWWGETGQNVSLPNFSMDNTTFSLVFENATLEDKGLYECSVERGDLFTRSNYYIRMYVLPRIKPKITLDTDSNRVNCTVEHVKPLIFPVLNIDRIPDSTETYAVQHEDGTYTTSVCCVLPQTNSTSQVHCSFPYSHYQGVASSDLRVSTTDSLMENERTTVSPMGTPVTFAGNGCRTIHRTTIIDRNIFIGLTLFSFQFLIV